MPVVHPVPKGPRGELPVISSGYHDPNRPGHEGSDVMYRRAQPGAPSLPSYSQNYYMPDAKIPAMAISDGVVTASADVSKGGWIRIYYPALDLSTDYMHLRRRRVSAGDTVLAGQPVGVISYNPTDYQLSHLHFQVRPGKDGSTVDPAPYLAQWPVVMNPYVKQLVILGIAGVGGFFAWQLWRRRG